MRRQDHGFLVGHGPARIAVITRRIYAPQRRGPRSAIQIDRHGRLRRGYGIKFITVVDRTHPDALRLTARDLRRGLPLRLFPHFADDTGAAAVIPPAGSGRSRSVPGGVFVPGPGCYELAYRAPGVDERIVFAATF